jgi:ATP-grasp domain
LNNGDRAKVLLCATRWWPLSARLAIAFIRHGCRVAAVCPPGHPLKFVTDIENIYPDRGRAIESAIAAYSPDIVVPCDEDAVRQLHSLHESNSELRSLIEDSLGAAEMYPIIRSRGEMLRVASELGIRIPKTRMVASKADLDGWPAEAGAVLKLDGTWAGIGVEIVQSVDETRAAYSRLSRYRGARDGWERLLYHYDASALWSRRDREERNITIQQFIPGRPANAMLACWRGEILSMVMVEVVCAYGATGISTVVRLIQHPEIVEAAKLLARRFMLTGFHGLDFMIEQGTGAAYLIEFNARCTQLGHLRLSGAGDLAGVLIARLKGEDAAVEDEPIASDTIAFFPSAFLLNPRNPYLRDGYHDVPWGEPQLLQELLREAWPHRQWSTRLYRLFRPAERSVEVDFDRDTIGYSREMISEAGFVTVNREI